MRRGALKKSELEAISKAVGPGEHLYEVTVTMRFLSTELDLDQVARSVTETTDTIHADRRCRGRIEATRLHLPGVTASTAYEALVRKLGHIGMEPR